MTTATGFFDMTAAPLRIGTVRLLVRDLQAVSAFYQSVLGLTPDAGGGTRVVLGHAGTPLLELDGDATLAPLDPRQAGLFHTAFLMPTRADLGRWLTHAAATRVPLQGASDHVVSEAIYLADPEGNGIEVYADRPTSGWRDTAGAIRMSTDPLDVDSLVQSAGGSVWNGFPDGGSIGHVHLQVGDTELADRFYRDVLGFDIVAHYPGASFFGSGGYHHQLAGNVWNSRRAGPRPAGMAGLGAVEIVVRDGAGRDAIAGRAAAAGIAATSAAGGLTLRDPWGTQLILS